MRWALARWPFSLSCSVSAGWVLAAVGAVVLAAVAVDFQVAVAVLEAAVRPAAGRGASDEL